MADTIATVADTLLVTKDAIERSMQVSAELRAWAGAARAGQGLSEVSGRVSGVLAAAEQVNKFYAAFLLARAALDLTGGGKTGSAGGHAAVSAMSTAVSAGGTLLGASAGFTVYGNLYIGPMVNACLGAIRRLEDTLSRTTNRAHLQLGQYEYVNWSIEPGGRAMFDWMLQLMHAGSATRVPVPAGVVAAYLTDNEDDFEAGAAGSDQMPMSGHWFWRGTDDDRVRPWLFDHRADLWGMLYGDCPVPR